MVLSCDLLTCNNRVRKGISTLCLGKERWREDGNEREEERGLVNVCVWCEGVSDQCVSNCVCVCELTPLSLSH